MSAFAKLTAVVNGTVRIVDQPPLIVPIEALAQGGERERCSNGCTSLCGPTATRS